MNVYDFDGTIYDGDSTIDFYFYCVKKHPRILLQFPKQFVHFIFFLFGKYDKTTFKEQFYSFLSKIEDIEEDIKNFWEKKKKKIKSFYLNQKQESDVIISASPEFLLSPICKELGVQLIASKINPKTGNYTGINCKGEEKVKRYQQLYDNKPIDTFYSDSFSDEPLAQIAKQSYMVKKDKITKWQEYTPSFIDKVKNMFLDASFILFLFVGCINTLNGIVFSFLYSLFIANANAAFIVGYITSLTISYFLNSFIAFKEQLSFQKYIKFCISYIPNFIIQNIIVLVIYNLFNWHKLIAYVLAAIIGLPITYALIKLFAFQKKERPEKKGEKYENN